MLKRARRVAVVIGLFGVALAAIGISWRATMPETIGDSERAQHPALELVAPAFAVGNAPPKAEAGFGRTVSVGQTVVLDGSGSTEPEGKKIDFLWAFVTVPTGSAAALDDSTAVRPSFAADVAGDYVVELVVTEGPRDSVPDTVTISTTNSAPVAEAGRDQAINVGQAVRLDGAGSFDFDGDALSYAWTLVFRPAGSAATLDDLTVVQPSFVADVAGDYEVEITVDDGALTSALDSVTLSTTNVAPVADAGLDQSAVVGQVIQLDASRADDAEGDELALDWALVRRPQGSGAKISTPAEDRPSLTVDVPGIYIVQLDSTDGPTDSAPDTSVITTGNTAPVADAGFDQAIGAGQLVTLDGGGSNDIDGDALIYRWALLSVPAGSTATLDDPNAVRPEFTADLAGTYVAQLVVDDGTLPGRPDTVSLGTSNVAPVADAGPDQTGAAGDLAQLNGGTSFDADFDALTFEWSILVTPNGSAASLDDPNALNPNLALDKNGVYIVQLLVSDGQATSAPDGIVIGTSNSRPVAEAGADQAVVRGVLVQLDGSVSSDPDNDPLTHRWALLSKPAGSTAVLSDPSAINPSFTADALGAYVAQLIVSDGTTDSEPDTVLIETVNQPPVANAGPDQTVTAGDTVALDGSASFDPDLDPLAFTWTLSSVPAGSVAALSDSGAVDPSFVADLAGEYVIDLVVNDGLAASLADQVTITADPGVNLAPVLGAIGNQTVALGSSLILGLSATDANGDPVSFLASPLPLPAGAGLDSVSGAFSFTPDETQVGDIALTFIASDGLLTDSESVTITVTGASMGGVTALAGRLLDANDAALGITTPIVGASVTLLDSGITPVLSDANGEFALSALPAGSQVIDIDSSTAQPPPAPPVGGAYASFREKITLISAVTNQIERPIYLPRIDPTSIVQVVAGQATVVVNPSLGVTMTVAADTAFLNGVPFLGELSISEVPLEFAPVALPAELGFALLISIQPTGVTFSVPAPITFPNLDAMAPGNIMDIYSVDPVSGSFGIVGVGQVNLGGTAIDTIAGGITAATWHGFLGPPLNIDVSGNNSEIQDPEKCVRCDSGSGTHVSSGNLTADHSLASYRSLNQTRGLRFVYNSTGADPRPVIVTDTTMPMRSAVPNTLSARLNVAGVAQDSEVFTSTTGLSDSVDETVHQAVQFDAAEFATGVYTHDLTVTSNFALSSIGIRQSGEVLVNNEQGSPFGAGWTLDGLERLHVQANGVIILTQGDGSILRFPSLASASGTFGPPINSDASSTFFQARLAIADFNGDGALDLAVPDDGFDLYLGDGQGQFPVVRENPCTGCSNSVRAQTGDFNNDGLPDVIVSHGLSGATRKVTLHLGLGSGFFAPAVDIPFSDRPTWRSRTSIRTGTTIS